MATALPLPVRFAGLIRFERPTSVLAWSLAPDAALAELHRKVWDAVTSDNRPETLNPFHAPGNWSPTSRSAAPAAPAPSPAAASRNSSPRPRCRPTSRP
ncbi:hypothetical protein ACFQV4_13150 [Streptomyces thermocarboxydus]